MRTYEFYENGMDLVAREVMLIGQVQRFGRQLFGEDTRYVDVLDEGVIVARVER